MWSTLTTFLRACFVAVLLLVAAISVALPQSSIAQSTSIIINEVELNPLGNDNLPHDGLMEQIELYNPTSAPIDVGGWTVQATHGIQETITLRAGTVIPSGGYIVVGRDSQWLDNADETVVLKNASGAQIDSAGPFNDAANNPQSQQRFPNGSGPWSIRPSTLRASNDGTVYPIVHMNDITASGGRALYSALSIRAEYVTLSSQLVGDNIDQITLRLARVGSPTGNAIVGVFDSSGNVKKQFGFRDVATITTGYADYTFSLANSELYTIQVGDRIGIKFTGGSSTNYVNVMVDSNAADPFNGANSYRQWFTTSWQSLTAEDMYMVLRQTHPIAVITHMQDTTVSSGRALYSANSIRGEFASPTSQLVGDNIDQITLRLAKVGSPTGNAIVGIFDSAGGLKRQFGTPQNVATIGTSYSDYTFALESVELYTIQSGDRIGIKFTGGSSTNYVNVMVDSNAADPFDGTKSYRQWFTTSWQSLTAEDMYMVLKQAH